MMEGNAACDGIVELGLAALPTDILEIACAEERVIVVSASLIG